MKSILHSEVVQNEFERIKNTLEDIEGRDIDYDLSIFNKYVLEIDKILKEEIDKVIVKSYELWEEVYISLDRIINHYNLNYGKVDDKNFTFEIVEQDFPQWFKKQMDLHEYGENNICGCDLTDGGYGLCIAGEYIEGSLNKQEFIEEFQLNEN